MTINIHELQTVDLEKAHHYAGGDPAHADLLATRARGHAPANDNEAGALAPWAIEQHAPEQEV